MGTSGTVARVPTIDTFGAKGRGFVTERANATTGGVTEGGWFLTYRYGSCMRWGSSRTSSYPDSHRWRGMEEPRDQ